MQFLSESRLNACQTFGRLVFLQCSPNRFSVFRTASVAAPCKECGVRFAVCLLAGDLLIIIAQIISAIQFVYEEKFIKKHSFHPLLVVGLEGSYVSV